MSSGWFDCTEPSLSTVLQGKQGVQGAYAIVQHPKKTRVDYRGREVMRGRELAELFPSPFRDIVMRYLTPEWNWVSRVWGEVNMNEG